VIISYNTESPNVAPGTNRTTLPGGISINPITWTRDETLAPALEKLSREVYQRLTGQFMPEGFPEFDMASVVTGRYVQAFFDWQRARIEG